jgi:hypothetical protein
MFVPILWNLTKTAFFSIQPWKRCRKILIRNLLRMLRKGSMRRNHAAIYILLLHPPVYMYNSVRHICIQYTCIYTYTSAWSRTVIFLATFLYSSEMCFLSTPPPPQHIKTVILSPGSLYYSLLHFLFVATHILLFHKDHTPNEAKYIIQ